MKKRIRWIAAALSLVLATGVFVACGSPSTSNQTPQSTPDTTGGEEAKQSTGVVFPLEEQVTLTMWAGFDLNASAVMTDYNGSLVFQKMEELTNVKINFIAPATGQEKEQFNLMIAGGEYPDMIAGSLTYYQGGGDKGVEDGVFLQLNDLIAENAPNYTAVLAGNDSAAREVVSDSGVMSAIYPVLRQDNLCWHGPVLRKDWLEETGLDVPVTIDDWEQVLTAMKQNHPNSTPLVFDFAGLEAVRFKNNGTDTFGVFVSAFGIGPYVYNDNGTASFGPMQDAFKDYLTVMNRWYENGLIDKDFPARDRDGIMAMVTSGEAGVFIASLDAAANLFNSQEIEYITAPYPVLNEGDQIQYRANDWSAAPIANAVSISTQCEYPEIAVAWLDYAFSEEGSMLFNFGIEGETYEMVNGQPQFTDLVLNNPDVSVESAIFAYKMHNFPELRWGDYSNPSTYKNLTTLEQKSAWTEQCSVDHVMPPVSLTASEEKEFANIMNTANVYRNEMVLKFIMGVEPLDKFDEYVEQLEKMGMLDAMELQQAALDRFLSR